MKEGMAWIEEEVTPSRGILMQIQRMLLLWRMDLRTWMKLIDYGGDWAFSQTGDR